MSRTTWVRGHVTRCGSARRLLALPLGVMLACVALVVSATPAFATIKLGQNKENYYCSSAYEWIQTAATTASYSAPSKGQLTDWMIYGGPNAGSVQFEVWRPVDNNSYILLYISPVTDLTAKKLTDEHLSPEVRVKAGDVIGLRSVSQIDCALKTGSADDTYVYNNSGMVPAVGSTVAFTGPEVGFQFNIAAKFK